MVLGIGPVAHVGVLGLSVLWTEKKSGAEAAGLLAIIRVRLWPDRVSLLAAMA